MSEAKPSKAAPAADKARKRPREGGSYVREKGGALKLVERTETKPLTKEQRAKLAEDAAKKTAAEDAKSAQEQ